MEEQGKVNGKNLSMRKICLKFQVRALPPLDKLTAAAGGLKFIVDG